MQEWPLAHFNPSFDKNYLHALEKILIASTNQKRQIKNEPIGRTWKKGDGDLRGHLERGYCFSRLVGTFDAPIWSRRHFLEISRYRATPASGPGRIRPPWPRQITFPENIQYLPVVGFFFSWCKTSKIVFCRLCAWLSKHVSGMHFLAFYLYTLNTCLIKICLRRYK